MESLIDPCIKDTTGYLSPGGVIDGNQSCALAEPLAGINGVAGLATCPVKGTDDTQFGTSFSSYPAFVLAPVEQQ